MGIYDRDYYRPDRSAYFSLDRGRVTTWLVGVNVACFLLQMFTRAGVGDGLGPFSDALVLKVDAVRQGQVWRLLTYAFLHDPTSILHILFNMFVLYSFGRIVEETIGPREFLAFYLLAAIAGGVAFAAAVLLKLTNGFVLGASGATMATLVLAACYYPRQTVLLFFVIPMPFWLLAVLYVTLDSFGLLSGVNGRIAVSCHLGGAAFGFAYHRLGWRFTGWLPGLLARRRAKPALKLYREDDVPLADDEDSGETPTPRPHGHSRDDDHLVAQADAILEKVQQVGMGGLSDHERQTLLRASEVIKKRRRG